MDFHEDLYIREIVVTNVAPNPREIRLFFTLDLAISGNELGDTAGYDPKTGAVVHYKGPRYFLAGGMAMGGEGLSQFAVGQKGFEGWEGTFKDAEDGLLSGNPIAQGSVDSVIGLTLTLPPYESGQAYYWLAAGQSWEDVLRLDGLVKHKQPAGHLKRTADYWRLWLRKESPGLENLPEPVAELTAAASWSSGPRSTGRAASWRPTTQTWSISTGTPTPTSGPGTAPWWPTPWTRPATPPPPGISSGSSRAPPAGGLPAPQVQPRRHPGLLLAPLVPRGPGPIAHPGGLHRPGGLGPVAAFRPLPRPGLHQAPVPAPGEKTADFMCQYRDAETGLPAPSYDLWEERRGILGFTVGTVFGGLTAASLFCQVFGEDEKAAYYQQVAAEIRDAASAHLWRPELGRFCRMIHRNHGGPWEVDGACDASLWGLFAFGLYHADDPRLVATMTALREKLWVNTPIGGLARYENDDYHRVSREVPGNPWFICTLWLADYLVEKNGGDGELKEAVDLLSWVAAHALPSGVLPEQINPVTGESISVSPLTWSHATFIATAHRILRRLAEKQAAAGAAAAPFCAREIGLPGSTPRPATPSTASVSASRVDCRLLAALLLQLLITTPKSRRVRGLHPPANISVFGHAGIFFVGGLVPDVEDVGPLVRIGMIRDAVGPESRNGALGQGV